MRWLWAWLRARISTNPGFAQVCDALPNACRIIETRIGDATTFAAGTVKLSLMEPGTHVVPHTGATNFRLRMYKHPIHALHCVSFGAQSKGARIVSAQIVCRHFHVWRYGLMGRGTYMDGDMTMSDFNRQLSVELSVEIVV